MDREEEYEQKLATLERSLSWLAHNRGILMDVLAGPGHQPPSVKAAMGGIGQDEDDVAATIDEGLTMLGELRSTSTFLIRTLKQRRSGPRMSLGTGLGLDDVVALVGEDQAQAGGNMNMSMQHTLASPEATAILMNDSDEDEMDGDGGGDDSIGVNFRVSTNAPSMDSVDPKLLEVIKEGHLYKLPLHVKKTDDHQAIPESKWKQRYVGHHTTRHLAIRHPPPPTATHPTATTTTQSRLPPAAAAPHRACPHHSRRPRV